MYHNVNLIRACILAGILLPALPLQAEESEWKSIKGEGEKPCQTGGTGNPSSYGALGGSTVTCEDEYKFKPAVYTGTINCAKEYPKKGKNAAAFRHGTTEKCYSCPTGYERSPIRGINAKDACIKVTLPETKKKKAEFLSKTTIEKPHSKAFKDPRNDGEWWRCPNSHPRRTLEKVNGSKACAKGDWPDEKLTKAIFISKVNIEKPISTAFKDPRKGGEWWKCPAGYERSLSKVTASDACVYTTPRKTEEAKSVYRGKLQTSCSITNFQHGLTGDCYSCGAGYSRSTQIAESKDLTKEAKACIRDD